MTDPAQSPRIGVLVAPTPPGKADDLRRSAMAVLSAWPGHMPAPTSLHLDWDEVLDAKRLDVDAVLVGLSGETPRGEIEQLNDAVVRTRAGFVAIVPPGSELAILDGVPTEPADAPPAHIASVVSGVARRRPVIDQLARELFVAQTSLRGLEGQMAEWQVEMRTAAQVQRDFVPAEPPQFDTLATGVIYRPAGYVSGDIYDLVQLDERTLGFFIADVVGHGVPAALMTLVISRSLRLARGVGAERRLIPPAEALERLNRDLCERETEQQRFATAVCGTIDIVSGEVQLAGAGHPPPILRSGGRTERIDAGGPLLGVFDGATYEQASFRLSPGDMLVMFSDGFETAFPDPGAKGDELKMPTLRYLDHFARAGDSGRDLDKAVGMLKSALDEQHGSLHQADDVTALLIAPRMAMAGVDDPETSRDARQPDAGLPDLHHPAETAA